MADFFSLLVQEGKCGILFFPPSDQEPRNLQPSSSLPSITAGTYSTELSPTPLPFSFSPLGDE